MDGSVAEAHICASHGITYTDNYLTLVTSIQQLNYFTISF